MLWKSLIALCVIGVALGEQTPVFLWGANSLSKPSLRTVPQAEFSEQLATLLKDHMVVAFEENGLSNKDFMCFNAEAKSCYAQLQGVSPKTYYTSVENPSEALRAAATKREHNTIDATGKLANPVKCEVGSAVFVTFDDAAETRAATLQSHDTAIAAISKNLECNVAYLYLAAPTTAPTVQRRVRRWTAAETTGYRFASSYQFQITFTSVLYNNEALTIASMAVTNSTTPNTKFSVTLSTTAGKSITFDLSYSSSDGYYTLSNAAYDGTALYTPGVNAPTSFSYTCGNATWYDSTTNKLQWNSLQLQAGFKTGADIVAFGDSWDCVGFVTPGILMGLFVLVILLVIVFLGLCWMMDIKTMDRFDDPKGKTITINASAD
ncbi:V-type proton ATPase subunit S1 [Drosophila sulfurigaster albostrigata]|uniref:V-type proton ATPase subunit S1 n=1 Tax=Drosophila sulfurigaster albostrigata TaxID=89887 RepID=UPI002D218724|nr:V-type proton ATPase subunit S1 [Drosophila sulfurigaster albostrigata]